VFFHQRMGSHHALLGAREEAKLGEGLAVAVLAYPRLYDVCRELRLSYTFGIGMNSRRCAHLGLIGKSAPISIVRRAPPTASCSLGLSPPKVNKTVSFFVSFHRGAPQSGILFLVSIARATARRVYHCRPWLSDVSHLRGAPSRFLARPGCGARRCRRTGAR
jgi:hypothetical protein